MTFSLSDETRYLTADRARQRLHTIVADPDLVSAYWDGLVAINRQCDLRPPLTWAAALKQRDRVMAQPEAWDSLPDVLRLQMVVLDDEQIDQLVGMIVDNAIEHYQLPDLWSLRDRGSGRFLTKPRAVERIIGHVIAGDRQDILETLADWDDSFKTMLAAVPLESDSATEELVRSVVQHLVAHGYSESATGGDWVKAETIGDQS
jgi:hypothetical protein